MKLRRVNEFVEYIKQNPYVLIVLALGIILLLLPSDKQEPAAAVQTSAEQQLKAPGFSLEDEQNRLRDTLEKINGVGKTKVLLSLKNTATRRLAQSGDEAVILSAGSGKQQAVEEGYVYPEYLGAVIVCQGGGNAAVRLTVYDAVSAFTGLNMSSIRVLKMEE